MPKAFVSLVLLIALGVSSSGCSATIYRNRRHTVDGVIEASDPDGVNVKINGRLYRVPAEQIDEIDHPGNVLMVIGGVVLGFGAAALLASAASSPSDRQAMLPVGASYTAMGVLLMAGGGVPWAMSRGAAMQFEYGPKRQKELLPISCAPDAGNDVDAPECPVPAPPAALVGLGAH